MVHSVCSGAPPRRRLLGVAAVLVVAIVAASASARSVAPGERFNTGDSAAAIAIQADGKIVAAGERIPQRGPTDFALARYGSDGKLDATFGSGGRVLTAFRARDSGATALAIQADGKIVVAGWNGSDFAIARYLPDGSLDSGFGSSGRVLTDFGGSDAASSLAIQSDGKIVVAGGSGSDFALARYLPDGKRDQGFGVGGRVVTDLGASDFATAVAVAGDGKIVVGGRRESADQRSSEIALTRYLRDGNLDPSFGSGGVVLTSQGIYAAASTMALQQDGRIVIGCVGGVPQGGTRFVVVRYLADGSPDPGFRTTGSIREGLNGEAWSVTVQPDGKILVAGAAELYIRTSSLFALARYLPDGSADTSFGSDGEVFTTDLGSGSYSAVAVQRDGKVVAAGLSPGQPYFAPAAEQFRLDRFQANGTLDSSFGSGGRVVTDFEPVTVVLELSATRTKKGVRVHWRTEAESDTDGFEVYRESHGRRVHVNRSRILARGGPVSTAAYTFMDRGATRAAHRYWLVEVASDGSRAVYGSALVKPPA